MAKWMRDAQVVVAVVGLVLSAGCSKGPVAEKSVGGAGGTVASPDGTTIELPPGAVPADTQVTITPTDAKPTTSAATVLTDSYLFGPEGFQFAKAVTVKIPFDAAKIPAGGKMSDLVVLTAPKDSSNFVRLPTHVEGGFLVAETMHFSVFTGALVPGAGECEVSCMASGSCSPGGCSAGPGSCRSSCDGQSYEIDCTPDGACMCIGAGSTSNVNVGPLPTMGPSDQLFNGYQMCGFPGALPCSFVCSNSYASTGQTGTVDPGAPSGSGGSSGSGSTSSGLTISSTGALTGCGCIGTCMAMGNSLSCVNGTCTCGGGSATVDPGGSGGSSGPAPASTPVTFAFSCGDDLSALEAAWKNNCGYPGTATVPADSSGGTAPISSGSADGGVTDPGGIADGGTSGGGADAGSGGAADMSCVQNVMSGATAPCGVMTNCPATGTTYSMQCQTNSACLCMKNGVLEKTVNNLGCADPLSTYTTLCVYP